jgi:ATP-dependent DNA helicase RecQ
VEWLAEWARDARSEQRGLLLLTAHRAKGLEFDDVVILNGSWERSSKGEDADAPRRLFYVAMTRARRSLAIITDGQHPLVSRGGEHVLHRAAPTVAAELAPSPALYQVPDLKTVDLSWAGRLRAGHPSLAAISAAKVGDPVHLVRDGPSWVIRNEQGQALGRMAKSWSPPEGLSFRRGEVGAIVCWRKADNQEEFRMHLHREAWESIAPELVFG